jgi:DNA-binding CsgD family transcriptional regulator
MMQKHDKGRGPRTDSLCSRDPTPSQYASLRERWNKVMAQASERDRQILRLRLEGDTLDMIGNKLQIHKMTVRRAIYRLIEQFSK